MPETSPRTSAAERFGVALALTGVAFAVQCLLFGLTIGEPVPLAFLASTWLFIAMIQVIAALALGEWKDRCAWAMATVSLPMGLALIPFALHSGNAAGLLVAVGALVAPLIWAMLPVRRGTPMWWGIAGAVAASCTGAFATHYYMGFATEPLSIAALAGVYGVGLGAVWLGGRKAPGLPPMRVSGSIAVAGLVLGSIIAPGKWSSGAPTPKGTGGEGPPAILIVLDTVRAHHLKVYGYDRDTMPNLERFARTHGIVVERGIANSSWSLPSHASLFTGLTPPHHGAHHPFLDDPNPPRTYYPLSKEHPTIAGILSDAGYWTVGISANYAPLAPEFGLANGYQHYEARQSVVHRLRETSAWRLGTKASGPLGVLDAMPPFRSVRFFSREVVYRRASDITNAAIGVMEAAGDKPFFLFLNYLDAHAPYDPPDPYRSWPGFDDNLPVVNVPIRYKDRFYSGSDFTDAERAHLIALYDGELSYLDVELGRLFETIEAHPRFPEMLVVITSDHGESFGDHDLLTHQTGLYDSMLRVPLFIKPGRDMPGAPKVPTTIDGPMTSADVFPLFIVHAGAKMPPVDGRLWGANGSTSSYSYINRYLVEHFGRYDNEIRSIERGHFKLIVASDRSPELYNLRNDPAELNNLASSQPDLVDELQRELGPRIGFGQAAPSAEIENEEEMLRQLEAIGYLGN